MTDLTKARAAALKAQQELAALEAAEAEKAAQAAAQRAAKQRELDQGFLAQWEALDAALLESGKTPAQIVYEGGDVVQAVADFWIRRAKRQAIRAHARAAYFRLHGKHPDASFAMELSDREMRLNLESAIYGAADMHAADLADALEAEWMVA